MTWQDITNIEILPNSWQLIVIPGSGLFKIKHTTAGRVPIDLAGEICLATYENDQLELFSLTDFLPRNEAEIFEFTIPLPGKWYLALRQKYSPSRQFTGEFSFSWVVQISYQAITTTTTTTTTTTPPAPNFSTGMSLWLNGSLMDKSGNHNDGSPIGSSSPTISTGIDNQPVLRWNGSGTQELQITPFLSSTSAATLYIVFTVGNANNYNLVRTNSSLDDYWHFVNGNGYFGTFQNARIEGYPAGMPSSGNHLISIHANASGYEVLLDNASKGLIQNAYSAGNVFRIGTNDKTFQGDIATLLVYPSFIDKSSAAHSQNIAAFKALYPSLSLS